MLSEQAVEVQLLPLNQKSTIAGGATGVLNRLSNAIVRKYDGGEGKPNIRVEKRPAFQPLATTVRNESIANLPGNPRYLAQFRDTLVGLFGISPYVYSETDVAWQGRGGTANGGPVIGWQTLGKRPVFNGNVRSNAPDTAAVGDRIMQVWRNGSGGTETQMCQVVDASGVVIKTPTPALITNGFRIKVVSDGTHFWVFSQAAAMTSTTIQVFDADGNQIGTTSIAWGVARDNWDVRYAANISRVVLATPVAGGLLDLRYMSWTGTITTNTSATPAADCTKGVGFLDNNAGTNIYLAGADNGFGVRGFEITNAGAVNFTFPIDTANADFVGSITGYAQPGGINATYIVVAYSVLQDNTGGSPRAARNNLTRVYFCDRTPTRILLGTQRSLCLASRAFPDDANNYFAAMYYQGTACFSNASGFDVIDVDSQPSYFVMQLPMTGTPRIVGQFEYGDAASFHMSRVSLDFNPWHLSSMAQDTRNVQHIALAYLSTQAFGQFQFAYTSINDYTLALVPGRPIEIADELLIGGLGSSRFDGAVFVEDGIHLAPEIVSTAASPGGFLVNTEKYWIAAVYEWLDNNGQTVQSIPSTATGPITLGAGNNTLTTTFTTLRTTAKQNVRISYYRTFSPISGGTSSGVILRKVGEVMNDPTVDTVQFVDTVTDLVASVGENMYTQPLDISVPAALEYYPAPPFTRGCVADGRTFVIGWDGAVWFSEQRVEGFGAPFNPAFRITLTTNANPVAIVPLDARMLLLCDDGSAWTFPIAGLPNNNITSGSIPQPEQVPFTTGATGPSLLMPAGIAYAAASGAWIMDRGISSTYFGGPVEDDLAGKTIADISVDAEQRVYFTLAGSSTMVVYDLISQCWYTWTLPATPVAGTSWNGRFVFVDNGGAPKVWELDKLATTTYADNGAAIVTTIGISSINFDNSSGYRSIWQLAAFGIWKGPHVLNITLGYDDEASPTELHAVQLGYDADAGAIRRDLIPARADQQSLEVTISDSFTYTPLTTAGTVTAVGFNYTIKLAARNDYLGFNVGDVVTGVRAGVVQGTLTVVAIDPYSGIVTFSSTYVPAINDVIYQQLTTLAPGNSFALETIGLLVGVEQGLGRLPVTRRIA